MKTYRASQNVGKSKHVVTFCDGIKTHNDGSHFADVRIFSSKVKRDEFIKSLKSEGYKLI